jgi:ParB-like chromosome segregation protein Spo0J
VPRRQRGQAAIEKQNERLDTLSIEYVAPSDIAPNDYNPNRQNDHEFTMLCRSITEDGFTQPVLVGSDGNIVDGEHRWRAAQELGLEAIPIVRVPMAGAQARIATLRHNRARGSEDVELSVAVLRDLEQLGALDWAADSLDMTDQELNRLLEDIPAPESLADEEYTEAWVPDRDGSMDAGDSTAVGSDSTPAALEANRDMERRIREARTAEERAAAARDRDVYRVVLSYSGAEAEVVKGVLGDTPAVRLLTMCQSIVDTGSTT